MDETGAVVRPTMQETDADCGEMAAQAELTYFDRSRRRFLTLTGLSLAGLLLPDPLRREAFASGAPEPVRIDRAVAWALQDAGIRAVTHVPATGASTIFDAYHTVAGTAPSYAFNEEVAYTMAHGVSLAGARARP